MATWIACTRCNKSTLDNWLHHHENLCTTCYRTLVKPWQVTPAKPDCTCPVCAEFNKRGA